MEIFDFRTSSRIFNHWYQHDDRVAWALKRNRLSLDTGLQSLACRVRVTSLTPATGLSPASRQKLIYFSLNINSEIFLLNNLNSCRPAGDEPVAGVRDVTRTPHTRLCSPVSSDGRSCLNIRATRSSYWHQEFKIPEEVRKSKISIHFSKTKFSVQQDCNKKQPSRLSLFFSPTYLHPEAGLTRYK